MESTKRNQAMKKSGFFVVVFAILLNLSATAQQPHNSHPQYILTTSPSSVDSVNSRHGLSFEVTAFHNPQFNYAVYLVADPSARDSSSLQREMNSDPATIGFEPNQ